MCINGWKVRDFSEETIVCVFVFNLASRHSMQYGFDLI